MNAINKIGALIFRKKNFLVVKKNVPNRTEYILPGGKPEGNENSLETLKRELMEELCVEVTKANFLGEFEDIATFEGVPLGGVKSIV